MNDAVVLAASSVTVALVFGLAVLVGFRVRGRLDAAGVAAAIARLDPSARVADAAIGDSFAVARLSDGRVALIRAMGDRTSARIAPRDRVRVRVRPAKSGFVIRVPAIDPGFPGGAVRAAAAPDWLD